MKRRAFILGLGGAAAWPVLARAQQPAKRTIGIIVAESGDTKRITAFRQGLSEAGFIEGQTIEAEYRFVDGHPETLPRIVAELIQRKVSVIVSMAGGPSASAIKAAAPTIPIVFQGGFDPVAFGLVASLNRPGGNMTGVTTLNTELGPKRLQLLLELAPAKKRLAILFDPNNPVGPPQAVEIEGVARGLGLETHRLHASAERDFDGVFARVAQVRAELLIIANNAPFNAFAGELGALTARHGVPAAFQFPEFAERGGLLSYGASAAEAYRLTGIYTGRVLKGEKPADLPVERVSKVEMIINLKTAKALGINVPIPLLGRADDVIE